MAKRLLRGSALPAGWSSATILFAATCAAGIEPAMAAIDLSAGLAIGYEHDSNPIELSENRRAAFVDANGWNGGVDDIARRLTANVAAVTGVNGPIYLRLQSLYTLVDYGKYDALDHTEYNVGGNLQWKPSPVFDASLEALQVRAPVPLNDFGGYRTVLQTQRQVSGALRLRPTPRWQLSLAPKWLENELPQLGADNFQISEVSGIVQLDYLGAGKLVPGVLVGASQGEYSRVKNATRYKQQIAGISLDYKVTNFSSFNLIAGYTRHTTELIVPTNDPLALALVGTDTGFTGKLSYQRELSVKTSINVSAFRDFEHYDVGVNTTVNTGFQGGITWKPTAKLSTTLESAVIRSTINGLQIERTLDKRENLERRFSLSGKYLATRRVSLGTYVTRRLHNSNVRAGVFDRTIIGLELSATID